MKPGKYTFVCSCPGHPGTWREAPLCVRFHERGELEGYLEEDYENNSEYSYGLGEVPQSPSSVRWPRSNFLTRYRNSSRVRPSSRAARV